MESVNYQGTANRFIGPIMEFGTYQCIAEWNLDLTEKRKKKSVKYRL